MARVILFPPTATRLPSRPFSIFPIASSTPWQHSDDLARKIDILAKCDPNALHVLEAIVDSRLARFQRTTEGEHN